jgi:hypothetical protein
MQVFVDTPVTSPNIMMLYDLTKGPFICNDRRVNSRKGSAQIPGGRRIVERYLTFRRDLPRMCRTAGLDLRDIPFLDYRTMVRGWLEENEW